MGQRDALQQNHSASTRALWPSFLPASYLRAQYCSTGNSAFWGRSVLMSSAASGVKPGKVLASVSDSVARPEELWEPYPLLQLETRNADNVTGLPCRVQLD